jgi:hypothetical protein
MTCIHSDVSAIIDVACVPDDGRVVHSGGQHAFFPLTYFVWWRRGELSNRQTDCSTRHVRPCLCLCPALPGFEVRLWLPPPASTRSACLRRYTPTDYPAYFHSRHAKSPAFHHHSPIVSHDWRSTRRLICLSPRDGRRRRGRRRQPWPQGQA